MSAFGNPLSSMVGTPASLPSTGDSNTNTFRTGVNTINNLGTSLVNTGNKQTQTGQDITGAGTGVFNQGSQSLDQVIKYLSTLAGGDTSTIEGAIKPQIDSITQQFNQIRSMIAGGPRSGGTASTLAQAPYQEAAQISNLVNQTQQQAEANLGGAATQKAQLGLSEQGVGIAQQGQGTSETALGSTNLNQAIQAILTKMGLNIQGGTSNTFATNSAALSALI